VSKTIHIDDNNINRFPDDFMFRITAEEANLLVSQNAIPSIKHLGGALPYVFTEQGIYMLASVLKSSRAVEVNIAIIQTFKKLREFTRHYNALAKELIAVDRKHTKYHAELTKRIDELIVSSDKVEIGKIGFIK